MNIKKIIKGTALSLSSAYVIGGIGITSAVFRKTFKGHKTDEYSAVAHYDFYREQINLEEFSFLSGKNRLKGFLYTSKDPQKDSDRLIVLSHGIWSGPEDYMMIIAWFVEHGWTVVSYSYTSYNGSEGDWAKGLPQAPLDLHALLTYIEADPKLGSMPKVLWGHSWGAYASCAVLNYSHDIKGVVSMSGFSDPREISVSAASYMFGGFGKSLSWSIDLMNHALFGKKAQLTAVDGINSVEIPILLVHGENDDFIKFNESSISCHFQEIINPNVHYHVLTDPKQSGHNNYFATAESIAYYDEVMAKYKKIKEQYQKKVPEEIQKEFFDQVDIKRGNTPREDFHQMMDEFMRNCIDSCVQ